MRGSWFANACTIASRPFLFRLLKVFPAQGKAQLAAHLRQQLAQSNIQQMADVIVDALIGELWQAQTVGEQCRANPSTMLARALRDGSLGGTLRRCLYSSDATRSARSSATISSIPPYMRVNGRSLFYL